MCHALRDEIRATQGDPARAFEVVDGHWVFGEDVRHLYAFRADIALPIPPETPVTVKIERRDSISGTLVAVDDFEVLLELDAHVGESVSQANVSTEPWFILEALEGRLKGELGREAGDLEVPRALLGLETTEGGSDEEAADRSASLLGSLGDYSLVPNSAQKKALARSAGSRIHFIWGPPGTGKTTSLAQVVRMLVAEGERVLVLAHANAAVDVAMLRVAAAFSGSQELSEGKVLRLGTPQLEEMRERQDVLPESILERRQPDLVERKRALELRRKELSAELRRARGREYRDVLGQEMENLREELTVTEGAVREQFTASIREASVLGATLSHFAIDDLVWTWGADTIIVDEASMAGFPFVFAGALRAKRRQLLFGDFRQLPPICQAKGREAQWWLGQDAYQISGVIKTVKEGKEDPRVTLLDTQYRMAPSIAASVSRFAYGGRLRTDPGVSERIAFIDELEPWPGEEVVLVDTGALMPASFVEPKAGSFSRVNPLHAALTVTLGSAACRSGCTSMGIISPYRAQARLVAAMGRTVFPDQGVSAATVHRFQGTERDIMLMDLVDAPLLRGASKLTGNDEDTALRLLNVAISRPKGKLVVLVDAGFVEEWHPNRSPARKLIRILSEQGTVVRLNPPELTRYNAQRMVQWMASWDDAQDQLQADLGRAAESVYVSFPELLVPSEGLRAALLASSSAGRQVVIFAAMPVAESLEESDVDLRLMCPPGGFFALLDRRIAYVGGHTMGGAIARIEDPRVCELLSGFYLGFLHGAPPPDAETEARLLELCGRCETCGEERRPRRGTSGGLLLRCATIEHAGAQLDLQMFQDIVNVVRVRCSLCDAPAVAKQSGSSLFLGCSKYGSGCRGRPPSLEDLFGG